MSILNLSWYRNLILLAILLRLLIMPFFFHPDIKTMHFQSQFLTSGVVDIYKYLDEQKANLPQKEEFVYFPLTYFFLGGYQIIIAPALGDNFYNFINDASGKAMEMMGSFRYLFLLKLPYLIFDIFVAILLLRFFTSEEQKKKALTLWLFNPFTIVLIYIFSNIDIIVVLLTLFSVLLAKNRHMVLAALILGIAAGFKAYPLLFLPFLLLYSKNIKQMTLMALACLGTLAIIITPFYSVSFQKAAFLSGLTTRILTSGINLGFGESFMIGIFALSTLWFTKLLNDNKSVDQIWKDYLAVGLILFSTIHFHIQWLLWVAPFLIILLTQSRKLIVPSALLTFLAFSIPVLYPDKFMSVSLLSGINSMFNLLPMPYFIISKIHDPYDVQSVLHSILAGGSLVFVWKMKREL